MARRTLKRAPKFSGYNSEVGQLTSSNGRTPEERKLDYWLASSTSCKAPKRGKQWMHYSLQETSN